MGSQDQPPSVQSVSLWTHTEASVRFALLWGGMFLTGCFSASLRDPAAGLQAQVMTEEAHYQAFAGDCVGPVPLWIESQEDGSRIYVSDEFPIEFQVQSVSENPASVTDAGLTFYSEGDCSIELSEVTVPLHESEVQVYFRALNMGSFVYEARGKNGSALGTQLSLKVLPLEISHMRWVDSAEEIQLTENRSYSETLTVWVVDPFDNVVIDANPLISVSAYTDADCSIPGSGNLKTKSSTIMGREGVIQIESLRYSQVGSIYLQSRISGMNILSDCFGPISVEARN